MTSPRRRDPPPPWARRRVGPAGSPGSGGPALEDIVIVDLSMFAAAPGGPGLLADLGARVVKVEPPTGDPLGANALGGNELFFRVNRGKERIVLDLKQPEGQEALHRLVARADVVVHNFRPGVPERLGADFATLSSVNEKLVYVYAASFGSTGPFAHRPAFDAVISAMAGGEVLQAGAGNPPQQRQTTDHSALLAVAVAIELGLRARDVTGRGQQLETTMLASAAYLFSDDFIRYEGKPPRAVPDAGQHGLHALYRLYRAAGDDWIFLACCSQEEWEQLCAAIGRRELADDPRFRAAHDRREYDAALVEVLTDVFSSRVAEGPEGWEQHLAGAGVACASATGTWPSLLFDSGLVGPGRTTAYHHPLLGLVHQAAGAIDMGGAPVPVRPCEAFGASTRRILQEAGYDNEAIDRLIDTGVAVEAAPTADVPGV